jgi:cyclin A
METKVLDYLDFHLTVTTTFTFMQRYLKAASADPKTKHLASYLCELSLPAYDMLKYKPSQVGAAAVYLARQIMSSTQDSKFPQIWVSNFTLESAPSILLRRLASDLCDYSVLLQTQELEHHSRYKFKDLRSCLMDLHKLHVKAPEASLQAVREKYSHSNTMYVAYINPMADTSWLNVPTPGE